MVKKAFQTVFHLMIVVGIKIRLTVILIYEKRRSYYVKACYSLYRVIFPSWGLLLFAFFIQCFWFIHFQKSMGYVTNCFWHCSRLVWVKLTYELWFFWCIICAFWSALAQYWLLSFWIRHGFGFRWMVKRAWEREKAVRRHFFIIANVFPLLQNIEFLFSPDLSRYLMIRMV